MANFLSKSALFIGALAFSTQTFAEVSTFGGDKEQFVGDGDLVPPECTFDIPSIASEAFFVKWDCTDNNSPKEDLRSELWIKPKGQNISRKVKDFLGFPASVEVNEGLLKSISETKVEDSVDVESVLAFEDYLPAEFRLIVRDRGGASTISEVHTVLSGSSLSCDATILTEGSEATGDSTGLPSLEASATAVDGANSGGGVQSLNAFIFSTCEIDELCKDSEKYSFSISEAGDFTLISSNSSFTGTGELVVEDGGSTSFIGSFSTSNTGNLNVVVKCN